MKPTRTTVNNCAKAGTVLVMSVLIELHESTAVERDVWVVRVSSSFFLSHASSSLRLRGLGSVGRSWILGWSAHFSYYVVAASNRFDC